MATNRIIIGLGIFVALTNSALANMPPEKYDHPYRGSVPVKLVPVPYTDDMAAYRACDRAHRAHYGTPYLDKGSMGITAMPRYGCSMYDAERNWARIIYTYDTPKIAKRRLAVTKSKQGYDQCMAFNSITHEFGHMNQAAEGRDMDHVGWIDESRCTYDKPAPPLPMS